MSQVCPHCGADLRGAPIPEESREFYGPATHFDRTIGVEVQGVYDGALFWQCPDCGGRWHRWMPDESGYSRLHDAAKPYVEGVLG